MPPISMAQIRPYRSKIQYDNIVGWRVKPDHVDLWSTSDQVLQFDDLELAVEAAREMNRTLLRKRTHAEKKAKQPTRKSPRGSVQGKHTQSQDFVQTSSSSTDGDSKQEALVEKPPVKRGRPKGPSKKALMNKRMSAAREAIEAITIQPLLMEQSYNLTKPLTWIYGVKDLDRLQYKDIRYLESLGFTRVSPDMKLLIERRQPLGVGGGNDGVHNTACPLSANKKRFINRRWGKRPAKDKLRKRQIAAEKRAQKFKELKKQIEPHLAYVDNLLDNPCQVQKMEEQLRYPYSSLLVRLYVLRYCLQSMYDGACLRWAIDMARDFLPRNALSERTGRCRHH